jgi:serine/threonine protein phosphatase PrpC
MNKQKQFLSVAQGAVAGRKHIAVSKACEDSVFSEEKNDVTVAALSDGCGSSSKSGIGSKVITTFLCNMFLSSFNKLYKEPEDSFRTFVIESIRRKMDEVAISEHGTVRDFLGTFLLMAHKNGRFILLHLGDGVITTLFKNGSFLISEENKGPQDPQSTVYFTYPTASKIMFVKRFKSNDVAGALMSSDGLSNLLAKDGEVSDEVKDLIKKFLFAPEGMINQL